MRKLDNVPDRKRKPMASLKAPSKSKVVAHAMPEKTQKHAKSRASSKKKPNSKAAKAQAKLRLGYQPASRPLGILGGGQLARMLALRAHALGIPVAVLSESPQDPAAQVTALWQEGSLKSKIDLASFMESCEVTTFESEFLDATLLQELTIETGATIYPDPQHMALLQDRLSQKSLLLEHKIQTAAFLPVASATEAEQAYLHFGGKLVFKKRRFGYDGYGTYVINSVPDFENFLPELSRAPSFGFIAEAFVPFKREIAVMIGRSVSGTTLALPFVESFQENSRCLWVRGPLKATSGLQRLEKNLRRFLDSIGYVGMMGVELFETAQGEWIVNELAPRVHNTGHYSMNALSEDQFGLHLKAVLDFDFHAPTALANGFAMFNLLGESDHEPSWNLPTDVALHWYGKKENRPGRKMGHYNVLEKDRADDEGKKALKRARQVRACFKL